MTGRHAPHPSVWYRIAVGVAVAIGAFGMLYTLATVIMTALLD